MDYRQRALYYLVATGNTTPDVADNLIAAGFRPEYLADYSGREGRFLRSAEDWVGRAALSYLDGNSHSLIPVDTLLARVERDAPPELREQARALVLGLRNQTGDGSDVPEIMENLLVKYKRDCQHEVAVRLKNEILAVQGDPDRGIELLRDYIGRMEDLGVADNSMVYTLGATVGEHLIDYQQRETDPEAGVGVPTGLKPFDDVTGGVKAGEVLGVIGKTKGGKTSTCGIISANAYLLGRSSAYAGIEMYGEVVRRRIEAGLLNAEVVDGEIRRKRTHIPDGAVRALECGTLPEEYKAKFIAMQEMFVAREEAGLRFWMLEPGSYNTIDELGARIGHIKRRHGLDLLWVDSANIQHLATKSEREDLKQGGIIELLRRIALANHIAVITDIQEKSATWHRRHVSMEEVIMYGQSIGHRLDHLIRIYAPPGQPSVREVQHLAARNGRLVEPFCVYLHLEDMIMELAPKGILRDGEVSASQTVDNVMGPPPGISTDDDEDL